MIRELKLALMMLVIGTSQAAYGLSETATSRYEVIVSLRIGGEIATGSAVYEAIVNDGPDIFFPAGARSNVAAEAIEIETAFGGSIFVLRRAAAPPASFLDISSLAYGDFVRFCLSVDGSRSKEYLEAIRNFTGSCTVAATPALVRFDDPSEPATIEVIEYGSGKEVELLSVEIVATNAPISDSITEALPWLEKMEPAANILTGKSEPGAGPSLKYVFFPNHIYAVDFKKEHD